MEISTTYNNDHKLATLKDISVRLGVDKLASHVLDNPKFVLWSGSSKPFQHHYGRGGLFSHTYEVIDLCTVMSAYYSCYKMDAKVLFLGALFHDCGKMWDYTPANPEMTFWNSADHKRSIHHISRSSVEWTLAMAKAPMECPSDLFESVLHIIIAHHGNREAWLVHLCDGISARMCDADTWDVVRGGVGAKGV
jgi:23S rRNA maturation-related 3'-5' exoribonuclease YhaM